MTMGMRVDWIGGQVIPTDIPPLAKVTRQAGTGGDGYAEGASPADFVDVVGGEYARLRLRQESINALARDIRTGLLEDVELHKIYPPYPPQQEMRMALLDQLPGLRLQLEALRYPFSQGEGPSPEMEKRVLDLSNDSRWQLARYPERDVISARRDILEGVVRPDTLEFRRTA